MNSSKRTARIAGFLYLLVTVFGIFAFMVVRPSVVVPGDAATTTSHLIASELLFRMGVASQWVTYLAFLVLPLPLYALLKPVHKGAARLMVLFVVVSVPIGMLSTLDDLSALSLVSGADYLTAFTPAQIQAQVMHFLSLHDSGYLIGQIFFGLWLMPLGYLVYRSGFFPRILGILLILGGLYQLVDTFTTLLFPGYDALWLSVLSVFAFSEIVFCLWLLIKGVAVEEGKHLAPVAA